MTVGERIQAKMREKRISQNELARMAQISQSGISYIIKGISSPKENTLQAIAAALGCSVSELIGEEDQLPAGFLKMIRGAIPLVGEIAAGTPITAEQNIECFVDVPSGVHADFALRCKGTSMTPTFIDGDIVLIRSQQDAEDGKIAAVVIADEFGGTTATLKRIRHLPDGLMLIPDNSAEYTPVIYQGEAAAAIHIVGVAVGYIRMI